MAGNFLLDMHIRSLMIQRRIRALPTVSKWLMALSFVISAILYWYIGYVLFIKNDLRDHRFLEIDTCPACYGRTLCDKMRDGSISFSGYAKWRIFDYVNVKNVYYGYYDKRKVVVKKLAHDSEFWEFDEEICSSAGMENDCDVAKAAETGLAQSGFDWILDKVKGKTMVMTCPTARLIDHILFRYREKNDAVDISGAEKVQLVTTIRFNPEPVLLQLFSADAGWPFPQYFGACGRFVVEDYVGESLRYFHNTHWLDRVSYSHQLLKIAHLFSDSGESGFALYFSELDYDSIVIDKDYKVHLIDPENLILVDRWQINKDRQPQWDVPAISEFDECSPEDDEDCISYSPNNLCSRYNVDHNYYVMCRNILSKYATYSSKLSGLLHDIPKDIEQRFSLEKLAEECAKPPPSSSRIEIKDKLMKALTEVLKLNAASV